MDVIAAILEGKSCANCAHFNATKYACKKRSFTVYDSFADKFASFDYDIFVLPRFICIDWKGGHND